MLNSLTKIDGYNPIKALLLKEFWDHRRAILITPIVITVLFILLVTVSLITGNDILFNNISLNDQLLEGFAAAQEEGRSPRFIITSTLLFSPILLWMVAGFTMTFTALSSLHDERKDGSILFWKSMPVSDTQEVLVKLATIILVIPLMILPFAFIIEIFMLIVMTIIAIGTDVNAWEMIYSNISLPVLLVGNIVPQLITVLWILPIITWFMLVSSFSRKPPFLIAFAAPAIIIAVEAIFFDGSLLLDAIVGLFENMGQNQGLGTNFATTSFTEPALYIGLVAAAAMTAGSIYFRKRNSLA